ncbi:ISL3 family transposase [uncultured Clostridium sp.]|uniref:ISL3 family transposase n=1 Tax=uncultured Clostridium sp. TaxID=59620 RepID=UPI0026F3A419|nr:ISL3 family transposase [uncultured Clostridium sp.]
MQNNFITNLLDLKGVIVTKFRNRKNRFKIHIEFPVREHTCPCCHSKTTKVHDYHLQLIKDIPIYNKDTFLYYRKRRYVCKNCGKRFYEKNSFLPKRARKTKRLTAFIIDKLKDKQSMKDIAKLSNVSTTTVSKLLPYLAVNASSLPKVLCIDEFRGNSGNYKYQVSLMDGISRKPIDIIECRHKAHLFSYFNKFSLDERKKVKYIVMDLWQPYKDLAKTYFPNAKIVADRFHYVRYIVQAVDTVRKKVQSKLTPEERKYFKHSRKLLLSRYINLNANQREELNYIIINYSEELRRVYNEKEELLDIVHSNEKYLAIDKLNKWVTDNLVSKYEVLQECAKTYSNWIKEIRNSLLVPYSNGVMEGYNNKIKVLKRIAFGFRNFQNFKARILLMN